MVDDITTLAITIFIVFMLFVLTFVDIYWHKRAFDKMREALWRGLVPLVFCAGYQLIFWLLGYNIYSTIIFLYFLLNALLALIIWNTEYFYGVTLRLSPLGRRRCLLHFYYARDTKEMRKDRDYEANTYMFKEENTTLETLVNVIDANNLLNQERTQFKTDEQWKGFLKLKKDYETWKPDAKNFKVTVLGMYDVSELFRGYKKVIYFHRYDESLNLIEGNCVALVEKEVIEKRKHEVIICWAGKKEREIAQSLEASKLFLNLLASLPTLEEIPNLKSYISKLLDVNERQRKWMELHKSQEEVAQDAMSNRKDKKDSTELSFGWLKYLVLAIIVLAGVVFAFVFLMLFGVI